MTSPLAVTSVSPTTWVAMKPRRAGAVRPGADRARDALHVDVAEVFLRQPAFEQLVAQHPEPRTCLDTRRSLLRVNRDDTLHPIQRDQHIVGLRRGVKEWPSPTTRTWRPSRL